MKLGICTLLILGLLLLATPARSIEVDITDSEFLLNSSLNAPVGIVLDSSGAPVQLNPSIRSYLIDSEYNITDAATVIPSNTVLDSSGAPVQLNPSIRSYLIDSEYNITESDTVIPSSAVLDSSDAPVQLNPSIRSYLIDSEYNITESDTVIPSSAVLDSSDAPVQMNPSIRSYLINSEYNITDAATVIPPSAILDSSGAPVQLNPSLMSSIIDNEFTIADNSQLKPWGKSLSISFIAPTKSDFNLTQTVFISGIVLDGNGQKIENAGINITIKDPADVSVHSLTTVTNSQGIFADNIFYISSDLPIGTYSIGVSVSKSDYLSASSSKNFQVLAPANSPQIEITPSKVVLNVAPDSSGEFNLNISEKSGSNLVYTSLSASDLTSTTGMIEASRITFDQSSFTLPAGGNKSAKMTISVPRVTASGTYKGEIHISTSSITRVIPVSVNVNTAFLRSTADTDKSSYTRGEPVIITSTVTDEKNNPIEDAAVNAEIKKSDGITQTITLSHITSGKYEGSYSIQESDAFWRIHSNYKSFYN